MADHVLTDDEALDLIQSGVTPRDLVRLRWPAMTDQQADYVLWELTPFPMGDGVHDIVDWVYDLPPFPLTVRASR